MRQLLTGQKSHISIPGAITKKLSRISMTRRELNKLEEILKVSYGTKIKITRIKKIANARKDVKEVYFFDKDSISRVWVIKSSPEQLRRELTSYYIAHNAKVPTPKPLYFAPNPEMSNLTLGVLSGIIEDKGDEYAQLLEKLELQPKLINQITLSITKIIADYHVKLTKNKEEYEKLGVKLYSANPKLELENRLFPTNKISKRKKQRIISLCTQLYNQQNDITVVSHGDIHTKNILTLNFYNKKTKQKSTKINQFGIIDWETVQFDKPLGDLVDFWVHQKRLMKSLHENYSFNFENLREHYLSEFEKSAEKHKLALHPKLLKKDILIQKILRHTYELYDPSRTDPYDIELKLIYHAQELSDNFETLKNYKNCKKIINELEPLILDIALTQK